MSLLREIQSEVVNSSVDLSDTLRKCLVLATRLGNEEFRMWVERELNGYESKEEVPDYRILKVQSYGNFIGIGWKMRNQPIPPRSLPEEYREYVTTAYSMDPISYIISLLRDGDPGSNFQEPWPADWVAHFGDEIYENMTCHKAWKLLPRGWIASILDTVRTRVLSFVIEIETLAPDAGEALPNVRPIPDDKVTQVFQTHIHGNVTNLAQGSNVTAYDTDITVIQNDLETLKEYLSSLGIHQADVEELDQAIKEDSGFPTESGFGSKVREWLAGMVSKSGTAAWNMATSVATPLLVKALSRYYGLDS